jgi:hypothetical protein
VSDPRRRCAGRRSDGPRAMTSRPHRISRRPSNSV